MMTGQIPRDIEQNPIYQQIRRSEGLLSQVYEGRVNAMILFGPPGIGKTSVGAKVAKKHSYTWKPDRPGTAIGLLKVFHDHQKGGVVQLDDVDGILDDLEALDILKVALDTTSERHLSHTVGGGKSIERFRVNCGVVLFSNRDFNNPKQFRRDIAPILDRALVYGISFAPLDCYEYTGWLATEGGMLRNLTVNLKAGTRILGRNGKTTVISENCSRRLTLAEQNDVLGHFATYGPRYRNIGPRDLHKFASMRLGQDKAEWLAWSSAQLLPTAPADRADLPSPLYRYQITAAKAAMPESKPRPETQAPICCL
jgi:hypothetical protein